LEFDVPNELFTYWDTVATARESYRNKTNYYFSGKTKELSAHDVSNMIKRWLAEIEFLEEKNRKCNIKLVYNADCLRNSSRSCCNLI
jgi:hypothetical protein